MNDNVFNSDLIDMHGPPLPSLNKTFFNPNESSATILNKDFKSIEVGKVNKSQEGVTLKSTGMEGSSAPKVEFTSVMYQDESIDVKTRP